MVERNQERQPDQEGKKLLPGLNAIELPDLSQRGRELTSEIVEQTLTAFLQRLGEGVTFQGYLPSITVYESTGDNNFGINDGRKSRSATFIVVKKEQPGK